VERLAALTFARLAHAEGRGLRAERETFEGELRPLGAELAAGGDARYAAALGAGGRLWLRTEPPGAAVQCYRFEDPRGDGRLELADAGPLGATPLADVALPCGSYLLVLQAPGFVDACWPVRVERGATLRPPAAVPLLTADQIGAGYRYVPPGESVLGTDLLNRNAAPRARAWVEGFCLAEREVTVAEYRAFLEAQLAAGVPAATLAARLPRRDQSAGPYWRIEAERVTVDRARPDDWPDDWPAIGVAWHDAVAYCEWRSGVEGRIVRLPTSVEWERAARGADERLRPWGDGFDWAWLVGGRSPVHRGSAYVARVLQAPADVSPFGVRDLAGGVSEWVGGPVAGAPTLRYLMGGSWAHLNADGFCAPSRNAALPERVNVDLGFRVAAEPRR
jgi:serine/threonine-protein kinase